MKYSRIVQLFIYLPLVVLLSTTILYNIFKFKALLIFGTLSMFVLLIFLMITSIRFIFKCKILIIIVNIIACLVLPIGIIFSEHHNVFLIILSVEIIYVIVLRIVPIDNKRRFK